MIKTSLMALLCLFVGGGVLIPAGTVLLSFAEQKWAAIQMRRQKLAQERAYTRLLEEKATNEQLRGLVRPNEDEQWPTKD